MSQAKKLHNPIKQRNLFCEAWGIMENYFKQISKQNKNSLFNIFQQR